VFVYHFALTRFFTIDEYQWGHATWLVREGKVPYRDFYEHHLPLGYILHSMLLSDQASFTENALLLRKVNFAYLLGAATCLGLVGYASNRDPFQALLSVIIPFSVGFGLMSAIDYRGDNWAAFALLCCFSVLELNQRWRRGWLSALAGTLFASAVLMTQKALVLGGPAIALMLVVSFWGRYAVARPRWVAQLGALQIHHPVAFCVVAALPVALLAALGGWLGVLERAFEITVLQAAQHEQLYPGFSVWTYLEPYLRFAPWTTGAVAGFAVFYVAIARDRYWVLPTLTVLVGGMGIKAPYPYNFVLASLLVGLCAVRGYCDLVARLTRRWQGLSGLAPLLHLLPLALVPAQLGFVRETTTNVEQLETLRLIESYTTPADVVIDSDGSALFRPDRGYYWYHGAAHVTMFEGYYRGAFVEDLRATQAIFWFNGFRTNLLPEVATRYLYDHYIRFRGDLFVLGHVFSPSSPEHATAVEFDVVRAGAYHVGQVSQTGEQPVVVAEQVLLVDGQPLSDGDSVFLERGQHQASIGPGGPGYLLSYLPPLANDSGGAVKRHAPLFEYGRWR
jgi:hypothetical protein